MNRRRLLSWALLTGTLALSGCRREEEPVPVITTSGKSLARQQDALDATVWRHEIIARQCERTMTQLADDVRRAAEKGGVLARFPFQTISIPRPQGGAVSLPLGIQEQRFDSGQSNSLTHEKWETALLQFQQAGWKLAQAEWQYEKFSPPTATNAPLSEFAFELHGEQPSQTNRFIISGRLAIEWEAAASTNDPPQARALTVRSLALIERAGIPGFNNHLLLAPEPDRPDGQVNLHPVIIADINADQHDDIVLPSVNKVLLNDGRANFQTRALIEEQNFFPLQHAGALADFDGDGKLDYLGVAALGPMVEMLVLFSGGGALPFTAPPVLAWPAQRDRFGMLRIPHASVITVGDVDGDGDPDVFVAQYRAPYIGGQLPTPYYDANDGDASFLLLNDGHGHFEQARNQPALEAKSHRRTLAASLVDIDGDGDLDLVTLNDYSGVDLFYNDGKGNFTDETGRIDNRHLFGMGLAFADFNRDGVLDFLATGMSIPTVHRLESLGLAPREFADRTARRGDMAWGNRLYIQAGRGWKQPSWAQPLARTGWSWGVAAFDFDNNAALDVYIANGHVSGESIADYDSQCWTHDIYLGNSRENGEVKQYLDAQLAGLNTGKTSWAGYLHNALFMDLGSNRYVNVAFLMGVAHESDCRAVVSADFNEDGRPDLVVTEAKWQGTPNNMRHRLLVHLNQVQTSHHWIGFRLSGAQTIGAKVFVTTTTGTRVAQIVTGDSFQSQQPSAAHFGLGESEHVSEARIVWPGGRLTSMSHPAADHWHIVAP